jgi:hypothetical protein
VLQEVGNASVLPLQAQPDVVLQHLQDCRQRQIRTFLSARFYRQEFCVYLELVEIKQKRDNS